MASLASPVVVDQRPRLLSLMQAAVWLNVSPRWMRRAVAEKRIPYVKLGRKVMFKADDLAAYIEANTIRPKPKTRRGKVA